MVSRKRKLGAIANAYNVASRLYQGFRSFKRARRSYKKSTAKKTRFRSGQSYTRRRKKYSGGSPKHDPLHPITIYKDGHRPNFSAQLYKKMSSPYIYNDVRTGAGTTTIGKQSAANWSSNFSGTYIANLLNGAQQAAGSGILGTIPSTNQRSWKLLLQNVKTTLELTNQSPASVKIMIYHLISRTDSNDGNPIQDWTRGLDMVDGGAATAAEDPYTLPTSSPLFRKKWKILKVHFVTMEPGSTHTDYFKWSPNRIHDTLTSNTLGVGTTSVEYAKGIATATMIVQRGVPLDDTQGVTVGTVTIPPTKVVGVCHQVYRVRLLGINPTIYGKSANLATAPTVLYEKDDDSGAVTNTLLNANFA